MYGVFEQYYVESVCNIKINTDILNESEMLSDKQIIDVSNSLNEKYISNILKSYKSVLSKFKDLKNKSSINQSAKFTYDKDFDIFMIYIDGFSNYAYNKNGNTQELLDLMDNMKSDISSLLKSLNSLKMDNIKFNAIDDEFNELQDYISFIKDIIKDEEKAPSNSISIIAEIKNYKEFIRSEDALKETDKKKYLKLYDEFVKFLKHPGKLSGSITSAHISDICRIIGISSNKLNSIISKNIKAIGSSIVIDEFENLGKCYIIESYSSDKIVYSINKKKLYWINYEHEECEVFYNNYPYNSSEFEDSFIDEDLKKSIKDLFKKYDSEKNYNIIK